MGDSYIQHKKKWGGITGNLTEGQFNTELHPQPFILFYIETSSHYVT